MKVIFEHLYSSINPVSVNLTKILTINLVLIICFASISGLNKLHQITKQGGCKLRVDLGSWDGDSAWAEYRLV